MQQSYCNVGNRTFNILTYKSDIFIIYLLTIPTRYYSCSYIRIKETYIIFRTILIGSITIITYDRYCFIHINQFWFSIIERYILLYLIHRIWSDIGSFFLVPCFYFFSQLISKAFRQKFTF